MTGQSVTIKDIIKAYEAKMEHFSPMPNDVWELRSLALAVRTTLGGKTADFSKEEAAQMAADVSDTCDGLYRFVDNLIRWMTAKAYTRLATLFDVTTIGSLALHDLREGKWRNPLDILGAVISEGSMIVASLQYTKAQEENMKAMTEDHISAVYGMIWELVPMLRGPMSPGEVMDARQGLDGFFLALRSNDTKLETRIAVIVIMYLVVIKVKSDRLIELAKGLEKKR